MATKFGASAVHNNNTKIFWIIGCVVTLFSVLLITFVIISQNGAANVEPPPNQPIIEPIIDSASGTEIVVPTGRIEEGTRLDTSMLTTVAFEPDKVPLGAIRKKDLEQIVGKFSNKLLSPNVPLILEDISETKPNVQFVIPAGYRAVTITVDSRSGVEGFAKPNSRVDVLWTFTQEGQQKVSTIVRFTKILSVGGLTASDVGGKAEVTTGATTVTLLVTEKDTKKIELARTLGTLSLSLRGDQFEDDEVAKGDSPDVITLPDVIGGSRPKPEGVKNSEEAQGYMQTKDPKTGKIIKWGYYKSTGKWKVDRSEPAADNE